MVTLTISAQPLTWGITLEGVSSGGSACDLANRETGVTLKWAITKTPAARQTRGNARYSLTSTAAGCGDDVQTGARAEPFVLPAGVAGQGRRRRDRAQHAAGAAGHGVRRAGGPAADHRPVHLHLVPARLRGVRPVADPGAGPGLLARTDDRRDDPAAGRRQRRPQASHRARVDARAHGRRDPGPRGRG